MRALSEKLSDMAERLDKQEIATKEQYSELKVSIKENNDEANANMKELKFKFDNHVSDAHNTTMAMQANLNSYEAKLDNMERRIVAATGEGLLGKFSVELETTNKTIGTM